VVQRLRRAVRGALSALTHPARARVLIGALWCLLLLNVGSGALVRVTGSGLGCPDWPTCHGGVVPPISYQPVIEYSNRLVAFLAITLTILAAIAIRRRDGRFTTSARLALAIAVGTFAQGPLGAITVAVDLNPIAVMSHFLLAILLLGLGTVLAVDELLEPTAAAASRRARPLSLALVATTLGLVVTGALVTESGPHPGDSSARRHIPRLWNLLDAAYLHVRVAAAFTLVLAAFLWTIARMRTLPPWTTTIAWCTVGATAAQILVGEYQWRHELPWWAVAIHVTIAGFLWSTVVALARRVSPRSAGTVRVGEPPSAAETRDVARAGASG
jgi:heme a synthase